MPSPGRPKVAHFTAVDPQARLLDPKRERACTYGAPAATAAPAEQTVETAVIVVARLTTPSSHGGKPWLGAAPHAPEEPLSRWVCSWGLVCSL